MEGLAKKGSGNYSFNDKMGIILKGVKLTYAYHLMFSRDERFESIVVWYQWRFDSESVR
jgi:hypothetical protein